MIVIVHHDSDCYDQVVMLPMCRETCNPNPVPNLGLIPASRNLAICEVIVVYNRLTQTRINKKHAFISSDET